MLSGRTGAGVSKLCLDLPGALAGSVTHSRLVLQSNPGTTSRYAYVDLDKASEHTIRLTGPSRMTQTRTDSMLGRPPSLTGMNENSGLSPSVATHSSPFTQPIGGSELDEDEHGNVTLDTRKDYVALVD